jgi:hypothetical protein
MTTPREPEITDELLSAYIDDAVTPDERRHIEQAAAEDAEVAWRLQSLQMTVHLLHELPALALPRSFVLTPEQAGESIVGAAVTPQVAPRRTVQPKQPGFWARLGDGWRAFWQSGSPALRNAMATSLVLFFVLLATPRFIAAPLGEVAVAPAAESARELPAAEESAAPVAVATDNPADTANEAAADSAPAPAAAMDLARKALPEAAAAPAATTAPTNAPEEAAVTYAAAEEAAAAPAAEGAAVAAESAPPAAAPMALSAAAGPDQSPAQEADPLAAARAVAPPAEAGGGPRGCGCPCAGRTGGRPGCRQCADCNIDRRPHGDANRRTDGPANGHTDGASNCNGAADRGQPCASARSARCQRAIYGGGARRFRIELAAACPIGDGRRLSAVWHALVAEPALAHA